MAKQLLIALNAVLLALIFWTAFIWQPEVAQEALALAAAPVGGDFVLDSAQGPVALRDFKGKVVVLNFGYTYCPDICPTSLATLTAALEKLTPTELARVQPIFVSVDPQRDDVARLAEYARFFHPAIIGLTGTPASLKEVTGRYGAAFARQDNVSAGGYVIDHTAQTYIIDPAGKLAVTLPHGTPAEQVVEEIRKNLTSS